MRNLEERCWTGEDLQGIFFYVKHANENDAETTTTTETTMSNTNNSIQISVTVDVLRTKKTLLSDAQSVEWAKRHWCPSCAVQAGFPCRAISQSTRSMSKVHSQRLALYLKSLEA